MTGAGAGRRAACLSVLLPAALAAALAATSTHAAPEAGLPASPSLLRLADLEGQPWHELRPKEGSLLGSSFRILVNDAARAWLRREQTTAEGAIFLKLNRSSVSELTGDPEWQRARLEVMRPAGEGSRSGNSWDFYMLGTLGKASPQGGILPTTQCMSCHRRRSWRGQPLFVDFYAKPDADTTPTRLVIHAEQDTLRVSVSGS